MRESVPERRAGIHRREIVEMSMRYVIIGNSAAGSTAAVTLRRMDPDGEITIVTEEPYDAYSRPLISYYLKGKTTLEKSYLRTPSFYEENRITVLKNTKARKIDTATKTVFFENDGALDYDKLLLATGSVPFVPPIEGVGGKANVFGFLNFEHAEKIKEYAKPSHQAVVIGGGLIGLKAAEGLSKLCCKVTVIELADRLLPTILDKEAARIVGNHIEENGISFLLGTSIREAYPAPGSDLVGQVMLTTGETLECDLLVLAVGVRPNTALAANAGIRIERGILTDEHLETSVPDIYAAGDCTVSTDLLDRQMKILALWPNAVEQGELAATAMAGGEAVFKGGFAMNAIDFFGMHIMTAGLINPTGEEYEVRIAVHDRSYRKLVIREGTLVGYILIGDPDRTGIYTSLISEKTPLDQLRKDILEEISMLSLDNRDRKIRLYGGES